MTLFHSTQLCGDNYQIAVRRDGDSVFLSITAGDGRLTMEAHHAFALGNAAAAFLEDEAADAEAAAVSGVFMAVDAAERVTA